MLSAALAQVCEVGTPSTPGSLPSSYHYIFIIDTSASMVGQGDGAGRVVFPKVKSELKNFLNRVPPDTLVTIQTFDQGPRAQRSFRLPVQRAEMTRYVDALQADGQRTYVYATLLNVLKGLARSSDVATSIYLFTDGKDNDPGPLTMADVAREYRLRRGPHDWLYYITLGLSTPSDVSAALRGTPGSRAVSAAPNQVPRLSEVALRPGVIDLGNLFGPRAAQRDLELRTQGDDAPVSFEVSAPSVEKHGSFLEVAPRQLSGNGTHSLRFTLRNPDSLPYGSYSVRLCARGSSNTLVRPGVLQVNFAYHPPAQYTLKALQAPQSLDLPRGESATLRFRLEGNEWARQPAEVAVNGLPEGLEASLNGEPGPVALRPGEELRVELRNNGFGSGTLAEPSLSLRPPAGVAETFRVPLPAVSQPPTLWERLRPFLRWLVLAAAALAAGLAWAAARNAPWARGRLIGAPPDCPEIHKDLRGGRPIDLGLCFGQPSLRGLQIKGSRAGSPVLHACPPDLEVRAGGVLLEPDDPIDFGEPVTITDIGGQELGNLTLARPSGR